LTRLFGKVCHLEKVEGIQTTSLSGGCNKAVTSLKATGGVRWKELGFLPWVGGSPNVGITF